MASDQKKLVKKAVSRGIALDGEGGYARHVLFCGNSGCCKSKDRDEAKATWKTLNKRVKELAKQGIAVYTTEVECLRFCVGGPLLVVYPEGTWYGEVTPEKCERIVEQHLKQGLPVNEWAFARNPMNDCHAVDEVDGLKVAPPKK